MAKKQKTRQYVLCIKNRGFAASLDARKIYVAIPDKEAESHGYIRVIDESGEDYLFPASRFVPIEVPQAARSAFASVA